MIDSRLYYAWIQAGCSHDEAYAMSENDEENFDDTLFFVNIHPRLHGPIAAIRQDEYKACLEIEIGCLNDLKMLVGLTPNQEKLLAQCEWEYDAIKAHQFTLERINEMLRNYYHSKEWRNDIIKESLERIK